MFLQKMANEMIDRLFIKKNSAVAFVARIRKNGHGGLFQGAVLVDKSLKGGLSEQNISSSLSITDVYFWNRNRLERAIFILKYETYFNALLSVNLVGIAGEALVKRECAVVVDFTCQLAWPYRL